jgi:signal peptidase I
LSSDSLFRRLVFGSDPRRTTVRVVVLATFSFIIFKWVLIPIRAEGISMEPTYRSGSLNLVNRLAYRYRKPERGDVVGIKLAGPHVLYVSIERGQVYINGAPLPEPYVKNRRGWEVPEVTLTGREYFVIGDNRGMRAADHDFGRVDMSRILGRVIF